MKVNESGRSMIEMLGVLAIIGVLSVGGIAGYTKAMTQYKINKTVEQVSHIVGNIRTLYFSQKTYETVDCISSGEAGCLILEKGHAIPEDMWHNEKIENAFGGDITIRAGDKKNDNDAKAFIITLTDLPEEACMAIATYDWGSGSSSGLVAVAASYNQTAAPVLSNHDTTDSRCGWVGNQYVIACPHSSDYGIPMRASIAAVACDGEENVIQLKFY